MNKVASFTYYGERPDTNRTVRLYVSQKGLTVDVEGLPELTRTFTNPQTAVSYFAGLREMSTKDFGSSTVDWGDYAEYADYWPTHLTPWNERI